MSDRTPKGQTDIREMKKYRIGEFARNLGVTSSFLKHYEQVGLVSPETSASGYRYYPFSQSGQLLAALRLHNCGFSLSETKALQSTAQVSDIREGFSGKCEEIRRRIAFDQALLAEQKWFEDWLSHTEPGSMRWYVSEAEELLFLPHTSGRTFLQDERIYEILPEWIRWMPMVKSCRRIIPTPELRESPSFCWGLLIPAGFADGHGIPVNDAVIRIPARRTLICNSYLVGSSEQAGKWDALPEVLELAEKLDIPVRHEICHIDLLRTNTESGTEVLGMYLLPI